MQHEEPWLGGVERGLEKEKAKEAEKGFTQVVRGLLKTRRVNRQIRECRVSPDEDKDSAVVICLGQMRGVDPRG